MADIKPTRSELMKLKKKIKLAQSGYNLLKKKRDGLILEFFEIMKKAKTARQELVEEYRNALEKLNVARVIESDLKLNSLALAMKNNPQLNLGSKNIMGVVVPKIETHVVHSSWKDRGYGFLDTSATVDEAVQGYEGVVEKIMQVAEVETSLKKLLQEIEKTKRRVNALEFSVIPKMKQEERFIKFRLEEMERENVFRLKRIKG